MAVEAQESVDLFCMSEKENHLVKEARGLSELQSLMVLKAFWWALSAALLLASSDCQQGPSGIHMDLARESTVCRASSRDLNSVLPSEAPEEPCASPLR